MWLAIMVGVGAVYLIFEIVSPAPFPKPRPATCTPPCSPSSASGVSGAALGVVNASRSDLPPADHLVPLHAEPVAVTDTQQPAAGQAPDPMSLEPYLVGEIEQMADAVLKVARRGSDIEIRDLVRAAEFRGFVAASIANIGDERGRKVYSACLRIYGLPDLTRRVATIVASSRDRSRVPHFSAVAVHVGLLYACDEVERSMKGALPSPPATSGPAAGASVNFDPFVEPRPAAGRLVPIEEQAKQ